MRVLSILMMAVLLAGCGYAKPNYQWDQSYLAAERLMDDGRHKDARAAFEALLAETRDHKDKRLLRYRVAVSVEREGRVRAAIAEYEALWNTGERDEISGHAIFRAGRLMYDELDAPEHAMRLWRQLLTALPEVVAADKALQAMLTHHEGLGEDAEAVALLDRLYRRLRDTKLGDNLLFRRATISLRNGDQEAAIVAYRRIIDRHPASGLFDNARWSLAEIYESQGRMKDAMIQLKLLAEDRDSSWQIGIYESEFADDARFRRGVLALTMLGQPKRAEREFLLFLTEYPESILRDDARWNIVQAHLRRGDGAEAREACEDLKDAEPESRWVDDCAALVSALEAGGAPVRLLGKVVTE